MKVVRYVVGILSALFLGGCGTTPFDHPLAPDATSSMRVPLTADPDRPFVVLAFSGGGSRAAALAASVVAQLDTITYTTPNGPHRLSEDIAVVSSVSGGSVYAAWIGLNGTGGEAARAFEARISSFDGIGYLAGNFLNPLEWARLEVAGETRISVEQNMLAKLLATDASLDSFNQPGHPAILLNASDMIAGEAFTFDPQTMDDICVDQSAVPVALAVTASAAFPGAFTPVLIRDASLGPKGEPGACLGKQQPPGNWANVLTYPAGRYEDLEAYRLARYRESLRGAPDAYRKPVYLRLVDGGAVDNLGLTAVRKALSSGGVADLTPLTSSGTLRRLVIIEVNARSDPPNALDGSPEYTTLVDTAEAVSSILIDSASAGSASTFQGFISNLVEDRARLIRNAPKGTDAGFEIYPIQVDFDQLPTATPADLAIQARVKNIPTTWTLSEGDVPALASAGAELLWRHPCLRRLLDDLKVSDVGDPPRVENARCPVPTMAEVKTDLRH